MRFEWDARKAARNRAKHRVSFAEAVTVFADPLSLTIADPDYPDSERRWVVIGESRRRRLVVVVHTESAGVVRIISARRAERHERKQYEEGIS